MNDFFGLSQKDSALIKNELLEPLKKKKAHIWIFGSRARGDFKKFSDLDVLFQETGVKIDDAFIYNLKQNLEDSDLTIKVDLIEISDLADSYKKNVLKERVSV